MPRLELHHQTKNRCREVVSGRVLKNQQEYLYWDYGHCRRRYDQAVRLGWWKGIRLGRDGAIRLYDLRVDVGETNDVAGRHRDIVERIAQIMQTAATPSDRYPIGRIYEGGPVWKPSQLSRSGPTRADRE